MEKTKMSDKFESVTHSILEEYPGGVSFGVLHQRVYGGTTKPEELVSVLMRWKEKGFVAFKENGKDVNTVGQNTSISLIMNPV